MSPVVVACGRPPRSARMRPRRTARRRPRTSKRHLRRRWLLREERHTCGALSRQPGVIGADVAGPGRRPGFGARGSRRRRVRRRHRGRGQPVVVGRVEPGSRPAGGRPEGLALTPAVVGALRSGQSSWPRPSGGAYLPFPLLGVARGHVGWTGFSSSLERGRAARSGRVPGAYLRLAASCAGAMKPSGHGQTSSST
jgi:hypothetical protein